MALIKIPFMKKETRADRNSNHSNIEEFENLLNELNAIMERVTEKWAIMEAWDDLTSNKESDEDFPGSTKKKKGLLEIYYKRLRAYSLALDLYKILAQDGIQRYSLHKQWYVRNIGNLNIELGKRLDLQLTIPSEKELEILEPILEMLNKDSQLAIGFVNAHKQEIIGQLQSFNDKKTAYNLRKIIILMSGDEITELNKFINDVRRWTAYRLTNRIEFFTERIKLYVKGGNDEAGNETFKGIAADLKDADLAKYILNVPEIRKLWTYKEEMEFFSWARYVVNQALRPTGKESLFWGTERNKFKDGFYYNLREGKNYINTVRNKFGNPEFADFLERLDEKIHQDPNIWERELAELEYKLHDYTYQNMHVIAPAQQALIRIFGQRLEQLMTARSNCSDILKSLLASRIQELRNAKLTLQKKFVEILRKTRNKVNSDVEKERREFESLQQDIILAMPEFWAKYIAVIELSKMEQATMLTKRALRILSRWRKFALSKMDIFTKQEDAFKDYNTMRRMTAIIAADEMGSRAAEKLAAIKNTVSHNFEQGLPIVRDLISTLQDTILPKTSALISAMERKLPHFIHEVDLYFKEAEKRAINDMIAANQINLSKR